MSGYVAMYEEIQKFYGDRTAERSGIYLMQHVDEGLEILDLIGVTDEDVKSAFCMHPFVQADKGLLTGVSVLSQFSARVCILTMEYRNIANRSLSDIVGSSWHGNGPHDDWEELLLERPILLSPLPEVNQMLIADKVQNRKEFEEYHKDTHPRRKHLDFYFKEWLKALGVTEEKYQVLVASIS